jgi:CO dehydrogenase/acetyl-CoA synthase beta subunit
VGRVGAMVGTGSGGPGVGTFVGAGVTYLASNFFLSTLNNRLNESLWFPLFGLEEIK